MTVASASVAVKSPRPWPPARFVFGAAVAHAAMMASLLTISAISATLDSRPLVMRVPVILLLAVTLCWGSNTFSHIHLHRPLFRHAGTNRAFSLLLSVTLGVPQTWWKRRHLAHHGIAHAPPPRGTKTTSATTAATVVALLEVGAIGGSWVAALLLAPEAFLGIYLPAWLLGLGMCAIQGHYEHAGACDAVGVDYHGRLYNLLWFNDGYHSLHHLDPMLAWSAMPALATRSSPVGDQARARVSAWPPLLRWLEALPAAASSLCGVTLDCLERLAFHLRPIRWLLLTTHKRAIALVLQRHPPPLRGRAVVIGGGLFPRTAIILHQLRPDLALVLVDAAAEHLERSRTWLPAGSISLVCGRHLAGDRTSAVAEVVASSDLLVVPLAYRGDRAALYEEPPSPLVIIHDWSWHRRGHFGVPVSRPLFKRVNVVLQAVGPRDSVTLDDGTPWPHTLSASPRPSPLPSGGENGKLS